MIDRHIFTDKPSSTERLLDICLAILIGLVLTAGIFHWFDALIA